MMRRRIVVACADRLGLDGEVSPHFGRCPAFTLVEVEGTAIVSHRKLENPYFDYHVRGALPAFFAKQGASVVLAGGIGRRALKLLEKEGIEAATGLTGNVRAAVEAYVRGEAGGAEACAGGHPSSCNHSESRTGGTKP